MVFRKKKEKTKETPKWVNPVKRAAGIHLAQETAARAVAAGVPPGRYTNVARAKEGSVSIGVKLPVAYLTILEREADFFEVSRGQFLTLLLKRHLGQLSFDRPNDAPSDYKFTDEELKERKLYIWYATPATRAALDLDKLQMGNINSAAWAVQVLNAWIGRPNGLRMKMPEQE